MEASLRRWRIFEEVGRLRLTFGRGGVLGLVLLEEAVILEGRSSGLEVEARGIGRGSILLLAEVGDG